MKAPLTDKDLLIPHSGHHYDKFRDVRKKAKLDEDERRLKARRDKTKKDAIPRFKIGDEIVLTSGFSNKHYHLVEIIDFEGDSRNDFAYYGILKKTTDHKILDRIGRLTKFGERGWWRDCYPANVENKGIKWVTGLV